jgi:hypothetical protein
MEISIGKILLAYTYKVAKKHGLSKNKKLPTVIGETLKKERYKLRIEKAALKLEDFVPKTFQDYCSTQFKRGDFSKLEKGGSPYGDFLAIFCEFDNYSAFIAPEEMTLEATTLLLRDALRLPTLILTDKSSSLRQENISWPSYVRFEDYFKNIELNGDAYRINCLTYSLHWASKFIFEHMPMVANNSNCYRYMVTESLGGIPLLRLQKELAKYPGLEKRIEVLLLNQFTVTNELKQADMHFPIFNDLVVYEKKDSEGKYKFHEAIVGVAPYDKSQGKPFAITIPSHRGEEILYWFDSVWNKLKGE